MKNFIVYIWVSVLGVILWASTGAEGNPLDCFSIDQLVAIMFAAAIPIKYDE